MSQFTGIDLSRLPPPSVVETLDYDVLLAAWVEKMQQEYPDFDATVVSDPAYKALIVGAYFEMLARQRINDASRQNMLAFATGSNLDHLAANLLILRKELIPANPITGAPAVLEDDEELRRRVQLGPEAYTTAGSEASYIFHALGAHPDIIDAAVESPAPVEVVVTVLSRYGNGIPSAAALSAVSGLLTGDSVRPLTDQVTVVPASPVYYSIEATLYTFEGPGSAEVIATATANLQAMATRIRRIGRDIPVSAIYAALHVEGVSRVQLDNPQSDMAVGPQEVAILEEIVINDGGVGE